MRKSHGRQLAISDRPLNWWQTAAWACQTMANVKVFKRTFLWWCCWNSSGAAAIAECFSRYEDQSNLSFTVPVMNTAIINRICFATIKARFYLHQELGSATINRIRASQKPNIWCCLNLWYICLTFQYNTYLQHRHYKKTKDYRSPNWEKLLQEKPSYASNKL